MKIQLDTKEKIIRIEHSVNLLDLYSWLMKYLPDVWREFQLETTVINNWTNPVTVPLYPYTPVVPWWHLPSISCDVAATTGDLYSGDIFTGTQITLNNGTFNIET